MKFSYLIKAFLFPIMVLVIHAFIYFLEFYEKYFWIDIPMHFLGGLSVALMFMMIITDLNKRNIVEDLQLSVLFIFVISFVSLAAVLWEFFEFGMDSIFLIGFQGGLRDTLADLFFGLIGGLAGFLTFTEGFKEELEEKIHLVL